jgi:type I restriction enzyme, S subunit
MSGEKTKLVPKLRFPEFFLGGGWTATPLGELGAIVTGKTPSTKEDDLWGGNIPFITPTDITEDEKFQHTTQRTVVETTGTKILPPGSVVYTCIASIGKMALTVVPSVTNQQINAVVPNGKTARDFIYYSLANLTPWIKSIPATSTLPIINKSQFSKFIIPYPADKAEQQKIAECLSSLDELIAAQARKVDALKTHKKGLMQQLFPREGETQPRLRFPEFRAAGKWKKMTLGSAANFYNGRAFKQEELLEAGKYKVLRVGNFFTNNNWYHSNLELDETKYCEDGDLLYAWSASFGPRVWHGEKTIYHYHIWKVVEQPGIDRQFLFIILEHETERMKAKTTNGLGIMHITKGAIESWESFFPGLAEQKKIADRLMTLDGAIGAEARKLESLTEHKRGMMQQLFPSIDDTKI